MTSTQQQRQEWRELEAAATPGEWEIKSHGSAGLAITTGKYERVFTVARIFEWDNAAFIAAARAAVPALLADVDALTQERDALAAEVSRLRMLNERIGHDETMVQMANEDLRAALSAVPVETIRTLVREMKADNWNRRQLQAVNKWLKTQPEPEPQA